MAARASKNALVLLSGGIDSAACAHFMLSRRNRVQAVHVSYGQASRAAELRAAKAISRLLRIRFVHCQFDGPVAFSSGEISSRNSFLLFSAIMGTQARSGVVALGIHAGTPYYDCSASFMHAAGRLVTEQSDGRLSLVMPFLDWPKSQVVAYFRSSGLPLTATYSCETRSSHPCGTCRSCLDRLALEC